MFLIFVLGATGIAYFYGFFQTKMIMWRVFSVMANCETGKNKMTRLLSMPGGTQNATSSEKSVEMSLSTLWPSDIQDSNLWYFECFSKFAM